MKDRTLLEHIHSYTRIFTESNEGMAQGIKDCLVEKGINTENLIVVEWFPDDPSFEYGIVVTQNNEIFEFGYNYLNKKENQGYFSEWENITKSWQSNPHSQSIKLALNLAKNGI